MNALCLESFLIDASLQSLVQELIESQTQNIIQLQLFIGKQTVTMHTVEKSSTFEDSSGVLLLEGEQFSGGLSELGEEKMNSPHLTLVLETILADQFEFVVDSFLLEWTTGRLESARVCVNNHVQLR